MVGNPATLSRCSPLLHRFVGLSTKSISHHLLNPSRVTSLGRYAVSNSIRHLGASQLGRNHLGCGRFQLLSAPGGGFGGIRGSGGGNYGGGGRAGDAADGSGGGEGDKKWSFVSWYLELLAQYPVLTKAITSALLTLAGDLICQLLIDKVASFDVKRTFLFSLLGLVLVGPTLHYWYLYLSKLVTMPGASGAFLRLVLDQFLFAPTFIGVFLSTLVTLEGRPSKVVPKLQQEWFSAVIANWKLWIPFQFLNFRFVPQQFQVLAANAVALAWNVILSFKAHKEVVMK